MATANQTSPRSMTSSGPMDISSDASTLLDAILTTALSLGALIALLCILFLLLYRYKLKTDMQAVRNQQQQQQQPPQQPMTPSLATNNNSMAMGSLARPYSPALSADNSDLLRSYSINRYPPSMDRYRYDVDPPISPLSSNAGGRSLQRGNHNQQQQQLPDNSYEGFEPCGFMLPPTPPPFASNGSITACHIESDI